MALEPLGEGILGTMLRYDYEVRDEKPVFSEIPSAKVGRDMVELAQHILDSKAGHFDPQKFRDRYETALRALAKRKAAGKPIEAPQKPRPSAEVIDLMDALKRSLAGGKAVRPGRTRRRKAAKTPKTRRKAA
jgi:Ku protein